MPTISFPRGFKRTAVPNEAITDGVFSPDEIWFLLVLHVHWGQDCQVADFDREKLSATLGHDEGLINRAFGAIRSLTEKSYLFSIPTVSEGSVYFISWFPFSVEDKIRAFKAYEGEFDFSNWLSTPIPAEVLGAVGLEQDAMGFVERRAV